MAKGRKVRASRAAQGYVEFSHFPPAVHFDLIRKQAVVIPALSRYFFDSSEISESVNFCVMEAIKLCRLDTPIIFIEARINLSRFVGTGCAAKTSATATIPPQSVGGNPSPLRLTSQPCAPTTSGGVFTRYHRVERCASGKLWDAV